MFGRGYEEIGSSDKGLILKNSGKIKILWGKTFIDLLGNDGNLNIKLKNIIREISSKDNIKQDGFYYIDGTLFVKIKDTTLELASKDNNTYVSFLVELKTSGEEKYTALQNIGFVYPSISSVNEYPTNGIIYIEEDKSLYIVNNGNLSKYNAEIEQPYTKSFIIHKTDNDSEGALVILGEGVSNCLKFDYLKIYLENGVSYLNTPKLRVTYSGNAYTEISQLGIITESINSIKADKNTGYRIYEEDGDYILDIDKINVRKLESDEYLDNEFYSDGYTIKSCNITYGTNSNSEKTLHSISFITNPKTSFSGLKLLILVPVKAYKCTISNNNITALSEEIIRLTFRISSGLNTFTPSIDNEDGTYNDGLDIISVYNYSFSGISYECLKIPTGYDSINYTYSDNNYYAFESIEKALQNRHIYIISSPNSTYTRLKFDFLNPEINLLENNRNNPIILDLKHTYVKIGNIKEFSTENPTSRFGTFVENPIFIGSEFRLPIPYSRRILDPNDPENTIIEDYSPPITKDCYPRYSSELNKGKLGNTTLITELGDIIPSNKWIPRVSGGVKLLYNLTADLNGASLLYGDVGEEIDYDLYNGKLVVFSLDTYTLEQNVALTLDNLSISLKVIKEDTTSQNPSVNLMSCPLMYKESNLKYGQVPKLEPILALYTISGNNRYFKVLGIIPNNEIESYINTYLSNNLPDVIPSSRTNNRLSGAGADLPFYISYNSLKSLVNEILLNDYNIQPTI